MWVVFWVSSPLQFQAKFKLSKYSICIYINNIYYNIKCGFICWESTFISFFSTYYFIFLAYLILSLCLSLASRVSMPFFSFPFLRCGWWTFALNLIRSTMKQKIYIYAYEYIHKIYTNLKHNHISLLRNIRCEVVKTEDNIVSLDL